jgi:hypothetical protein
VAVETLLALLFTVFAVPGACLLVCIVQVVRGMIRGSSAQRQHRVRRREYGLRQ